ncbi:MAG: hypothetical protein M1822_006409 [Bathelium mastoideum]|nr:MAG: hypothetical protein M1822_006409 [Bathelium mastoideum]
MEEPQARAEAIRSALKSAATCSSTTVSNLRDLLHAQRLNKENIKPTPAEKNGRATDSKRLVRPKVSAERAAKTTAKGKSGAVVNGREELGLQLSAKEKYVLAQETINSSLRSLTEAVRPKPRGHPPTSSNRQDIGRKSSNDSPMRQPAKSASPLKQLEANIVSNANGKTSTDSRSSSITSSSKQDPTNGVVAVAECARTAFTYLRLVQTDQRTGKALPPLQLENGMLALVGKLVNLGLDTLATKELCILKSRLEKLMEDEMRAADTCETKKVRNNNAASKERETLATLLSFKNMNLDSSALPIVVSHQMLVLRIIAAAKRPTIIEGALEYLRSGSPCSPTNLISRTVQSGHSKERAADQLRSLGHIYLSLCPSSFSSHDASACDPKICPAPETAFALQELALETRVHWWSLVNHQADLDSELLEPYSKNLNALVNRSSASSNQIYAITQDATARLQTLIRDLLDANDDYTNFRSWSSIQSTLSTVAQNTGDLETAVKHAVSALATSKKRGTPTEQDSLILRLATLAFENWTESGLTNATEDNAKSKSAVKVGLNLLSGEPRYSKFQEQSLILAPVMTLRRAVVKFLVKKSQEHKIILGSGHADILHMSHAIIFRSLRFLIGFMNAIPLDAKCTDSPPKGSRFRALAAQAVKGSIDSALGILKSLVARNDIAWDNLCSLLEDCSTAIALIESWVQDAYLQVPPDFNPSQSLVKVSNMYWAFQSQRSKHSDAKNPDESIQALVRSIDLLRPRSKAEQEAGLLAVKLEKLATALDSAGRLLEAHTAIKGAIELLVQHGALQEAAKIAADKALRHVWTSDGQIGQLGRLLIAMLKRLKHDDGGLIQDSERVFDSSPMAPDERGILLEQQLCLNSATISPRKPADAHTIRLLQEISRRLLTIYAPSDFPIRRQRVKRTIVQIATDFPAILDDELRSLALEEHLINKQCLGADAGLQKFQAHINAGWRIGRTFCIGLPKFEDIKLALLDWQCIVEVSPTWDVLLQRVDDVESFLIQLHAVANFLDMQGLGLQRLPILSMISRIEELRRSFDLAALITSKANLTSQYLRLGYSGKAGDNLVNARSLMSSSTPLPEVMLALQMIHAQYSLDVGDTSNCYETLHSIASLAAEPPEFHKLSSASGSSSGRVRYNNYIADASSIISKLALQSGYHDEALAQAKRSVRLHQKNWVILENRQTLTASVSTLDATESAVDIVTEEISRMGINSRPSPPIQSMTHEKLRGPVFWPLVSSLVRALLHLGDVYGCMGLFQEAIYYSEQAEKVGSAVQADALLSIIHAKMSEYWARSHKEHDAQRLLEKIPLRVNRSIKTYEMVLSHQSMARLEHLRGNGKAELECIDSAISILRELMSSTFIETLDRLPSSEARAAGHISLIQINSEKKRPPKNPGSRKPQAKRIVKSTPRSHDHDQRAKEQGGNPAQVSRLAELLANLLAEKAVALLLIGNLPEACEILRNAKAMLVGCGDTILHHMASFKTLLARATDLLSSDFTFNVLSESTISFPAVTHDKTETFEGTINQHSLTSTAQKGRGRSQSPQKRARKAVESTSEFAIALQQARDCIIEVHDKALRTGSTSVCHILCHMLGHVTVLLSAASSECSSAEPLIAAQSLELSRDHAVQSDINATAIDKRQSKRQDMLAWPTPAFPLDEATLSGSRQFQQEFINVIPDSWTAISISLDEAQEVFHIVRYRAQESPFILRLPISRQKADDMDDDESFTFDQGKQELLEIISLSNDSTHDTRDMSVKGAKSAWWAEREALDARLRDLLRNIENIWLGGFRGTFSQHARHPHLLAQFSASFQNILNRHLPSRQGKVRGASNAKGKRNASKSQLMSLDSRVLELFIGLGNANDNSLDIDEAMMDLVYFVVDILQFNGERNAYDEIDFEAIVVETIDALKAYHEEASQDQTANAPEHMILILDKELHVFPWESLPCLDQLAISRVPSMKALRDRILIQRQQARKGQGQSHPTSTAKAAQPQGFHSDRSKISYILNPSGDLSHTEKTLTPPLRSLPPNLVCSVPSLTARSPSERDFETLLTHSDVVLYFGHGSGAQYIRTRSIKRLSRCASVVWLIGCSSGAVVENGEFEPHGAVLGYLVAGWSNEDGVVRDMDLEGRRRDVESEGEEDDGEGEEQTSPCMAVCATLWDVTDKDIDRFSVRLGEEWGLWSGSAGCDAADSRASKTPKTPKRRGGRRRDAPRQKGRSLAESVARSRGECYLRYLNGAAPVVYGVPVWLGD